MTSPERGEQLTYKQRKFCEQYVISHNATQAALAAGYSAKCAAVTATRTLTKANIKNYIAKLEGKALAKATEGAILTRSQVLQRISQLASNADISCKDQLRALEDLAKYYGMFEGVPDSSQQSALDKLCTTIAEAVK